MTTTLENDQLDQVDEQVDGVSDQVDESSELADEATSELADESPADDSSTSDDGAAEASEEPLPPADDKAGRAAAERDLIRRITELMPDIRTAETELESAKEEAKAAKELVEFLHKKLVEFGKELEEIQSGQWQRKLPFAADEDGSDSDDGRSGSDSSSSTVTATATTATSADEGSAHPISALGMTAKETEALEAAELDTVGKLEAAIRADAWWFKKVERFGPAKVDKLMDKLLEFRQQFPVPGE